MKQTTLFEHNLKILNTKSTLKASNISNKNNSKTDDTKDITATSSSTDEYTLKKVLYKPSNLDSDRINGFDTSKTDWIYPINYPVRNYQLQIVQECLFKNTLVCLPTGLGKTFIASVVMYNFYRWYPSGKLVFVAPTRPLVNQQMYACQEIIPIDSSEIIEMTGSINHSSRIDLWSKKRIFFLTAQVFVNDLVSKICPGDKVVFVALDEAHKASKNHAYCQVVRELTGERHNNRLFRILGLSATPGNELTAIQEVIQNLLICHIELRTDECPDIQQYSHQRLVEEVVVSLDATVINVRDKLFAICSPIIDRLKRMGGICSNIPVHGITKFGLLKMKEEYKSRASSYMSSNVLSDFAQAISLYYGIELVQQHGLKPTFRYFANAIANSQSMPQIIDLMLNKNFTDFFEDIQSQVESDKLIVGHPKLGKLKTIIYEHFTNRNAEDQKKSRVIVFSQIRDSVEEIIQLLKEMEPLIRPIAFMGRAKSVSQREQMEAMRLFANGTYNVLVSTCIGEEGLDIGEVDLIVCFDSQKSPIRLIQRSGRTGRKKEGRVVMLLSEGKEVSNYRTSLHKKSRIHSAIFEGYKHLVFYPNNPRMVPLGIEPTVSYQKVILPKIIKKSPTKKKRVSTKQQPIIESIFTLSQQPTLCTDPDVPEPMRFLKEEAKNSAKTFTQRHKPYRHKRPLYQAQPTFKITHSDLTKNVVSILKLKEQHRRGNINIIFHLSSSRIMNIEEPLTESQELSQSSCQDSSFNLTSDDGDDNFPCISIQSSPCLRKIDNSVFLSSFKQPIKSILPKNHFDDLLKYLELNKPNIIDWLDRETQKVMNQSNHKPKEKIPNFPIKLGAENLFRETNNLCTSTPISSVRKPFSARKILESFKIPQENSVRRNKTLLRSFRIPRQENCPQIPDKIDNSGNKQSSLFGVDLFSDLLGETGVLSCELSMDLFETDVSFRLSESDTGREDQNRNSLSSALIDRDVVLGEGKDKKNEVFIEDKERVMSPEISDSLLDCLEFHNSKQGINLDCDLMRSLDKEDAARSDEDLFSDDWELYSPISDGVDLSSVGEEKVEDGEILVPEGMEEDKENEIQDFGMEDAKKKKEHDEEKSLFSDCSDSFLMAMDLEEPSRSKSPSFCSEDMVEDREDSKNLEEPASSSSVNFTKKTTKNPVRNFFLTQAVEMGHLNDNEEECEFDDDFESSFIDDAEKSALMSTQMHQIYLQSIRSPKFRRKSPKPEIKKPEYIYSQPLSSDDDYIMDSFIVPDDYKTPKRKRPKLSRNSTGTPAKKFKRLRSLNDSVL